MNISSKIIAKSSRQVLAWLICAMLNCACENSQIVKKEAYIFATRIEIMVLNSNNEEEKNTRIIELAINQIFQDFERLHLLYQVNNNSALGQLNFALKNHGKAKINKEMAGYIIEAQKFCQLSDGLFDPGIGAIIQLWGWHDASAKQQLPDAAALKHLIQAKPSIKDLQIQQISDNLYQVSSDKPEVQLDFGGYLKGVALDRARQIFDNYQIKHALINIGGNILALGNRSGIEIETSKVANDFSLAQYWQYLLALYQRSITQAWRVGIQHPRQPGLLATLSLNDGEAIGTSGDYQRFFFQDGKRYHHLIEPQSGYPNNSTSSLSVVIKNRRDTGTWSDFSSKPLFLSGDAWRDYAKKLQIEQVIRVKENGEIEVSEALASRLKWY